MKQIVVLGSYNTGLTMSVERAPRAGETVLGRGFSQGPGGKGSNQAIAARRLGAGVSFVGCIGTDAFGDDALELWRKEGVEASCVKRVARHTGIGFVVVDSSGENVITVDPGANADLGADDVARLAEPISRAGVLLMQLEVPVGTVEAAASVAKRAGATTILNPAPVAGRVDLADIDILTPNEQEFGALTGGQELAAGCRELLGRGPEAVIVTLGESGAYVSTRGGSFAVPAPKVKALDTTGAGDAFNGALAVALAEGKPLASAVAFANYAGALTVTRRQVVPALPTRAELDAFMASAAVRPSRP